MVTKSISAETAIINLHPNARGRRGQIAGGNIRLALCAEKQAFCITITSIILTTDAATRSVTILSLNGNRLPLQFRLCPLFSENMILSVSLFHTNYCHGFVNDLSWQKFFPQYQSDYENCL